MKVFIKTAPVNSAHRGYKTVAVEGEYDQALTIPMYQHYGFTSMPPVGTELIAVGAGNNVASIAEDPDGRPDVNAGEVCVYFSDEQYVKLCVDGSIEVVNKNGNITLDGNGKVDVNDGNLTVNP